MESFAVDLDKVLDDFEESEEVEVIDQAKVAAQYQSDDKFAEALNPSLGSYALQQGTFTADYADEPSIYDQGSGIFDLSEASFGPSVSEANKNNLHMFKNEETADTAQHSLSYDSKEGYFVPEGPKSGTFESSTTVTSIKDSSYIEDNFAVAGSTEDSIYSNIISEDNRPEILQAATELQAHLDKTEDRPSFMSSSPPTESFTQHGPPDIIPPVNTIISDTIQSSSTADGDSHHNQLYQYDQAVVKSEDDSSNNYNKIDDVCIYNKTADIPQNNSSSNLYRYDQAMASSSESGGLSACELVDQQYNIVSSVPDIAKDEPQSKSESPGIIIEHGGSIDPVSSKTVDSDVMDTSINNGPPVNNVDILCTASVSNSNDLSNSNFQNRTDEMSYCSVKPDVTLSCIEPSDNSNSNDTSKSVGDLSTVTHTEFYQESDSIISEVTDSGLQNKQNVSDELTKTDVDNSNINFNIHIPITSDIVSGHREQNLLINDSNNKVEKQLESDNEHKLTPVISNEQVSTEHENSQESSVENSSIIGMDVKSDSEKFSLIKNATEQIKDPQSIPVSQKQDTTSTIEEISKQVDVTNSNISKATGDAPGNNKEALKQDDIPLIGDESNMMDNLLPDSVDLNLVAAEAENDLAMLEEELMNEQVTCKNATYHNNEEILQTTKEGENVNKDTSITPTIDDNNIKNNLDSDSGLNTRRGSGGSVERFLAPSVMSPGIATPMEDAGFTKIPGFTPGLVSMPEDELESSVDSSVQSSGEKMSEGKSVTNANHSNATVNNFVSTSSAGARPKDIAVPPNTGSLEKPKKNRPNSLLGLSTPDLPAARLLENDRTSPYEQNQGNVVASEMNPLYIASMQRPGVVPNRVAGRPNSLGLQNGPSSRPGISPTMANIPGVGFGGNNMGVSSNSMVSQIPIQPASLNVQQEPQTPPPAYSVHPQVQQHPPGQLNHSGPVPPSSLSLSMPGGLSLVSGGSMGGVSPVNTHPPLHRVSAGNSFPQGMIAPSLQQPRPSSFSGVVPPEMRAAQERQVPPSAFQDGDGSSSVDSASEAMEVAQHNSVLDSLEMPPGLTPSSGQSSGMMLPPPSSSNPNFSITDLGKLQPTWLPDAEAPNCMQCETRFTFTKRRHHCRACGKVFCSACCNLKSKIQYLEWKEARVCSKCYQDLIRAQVFERMGTNTNRQVNDGMGSNPPFIEGGGGQQQPQLQQQSLSQMPSPNPNNPSEYCSTIPPLQQAQQASGNASVSTSTTNPPLSVMVPVGVLRKEVASVVNTGSFKRDSRESKQVMFSDGIKPGGDLTELDGSSQQTSQKSSRKNRKSPANGLSKLKAGRSEILHFIPESGLPPIFICMGDNGEIIKEDNPNVENTMLQIKGDEASSPIPFVVNKNLVILVKLVILDCCLNKTCFCFTSKGLCTVGQNEVVIVLECLPDEKILPLDVFRHFQSLYEQAFKGNTVSNMDHSIFAQLPPTSNSSGEHNAFLGSQEHGGFLYLSPSFQCLNKLVVPQTPYLCAVLLQKWELPWAKVFPLRLMLRLGAEFRYYPCPIVSVRYRKPVFGEIGHTIMNLLVDFRNYQYSIPQVRGFTIHMRDKKTYLNFPKNRYQDVVRVLSSGNEHVIAVGANFSQDADSYLVCIQNDEGNYQTQAINIQNKPRKVTGASFVVFNGALKSSSGISGKSSIVEDGLMVQVLPEVMLSIREALKDMKDFSIKCGGAVDEDNKPEEEVVIEWVEDDKNFNIGLKSPVDDFPLEGVESVHIHNIGDCAGPGNKAIRWVEVFFLQTNEESSRLEPVDLSRLAETLATATGAALAPSLDKLAEAGLDKIGLRATIDNENVGYQAGSNGQKFPDFYMNSLDNELIPVIHNAASQNRGSSVTLELIFHIINT